MHYVLAWIMREMNMWICSMFLLLLTSSYNNCFSLGDSVFRFREYPPKLISDRDSECSLFKSIKSKKLEDSGVFVTMLWEGAVWDAVDKLGFISGLVVNVASGLSAVTYWLAVSIEYGLAAPKPSSQVADMETGISGSGRVSVSGQNSISGTTPIPRPSGAPGLVTMSQVGSARLTSLERVTTFTTCHWLLSLPVQASFLPTHSLHFATEPRNVMTGAG